MKNISNKYDVQLPIWMKPDKTVLIYWIKRLLLLVGVLLIVNSGAKILFQAYLDSSFHTHPTKTLNDTIPENLIRGSIEPGGIMVRYHDQDITYEIHCSGGGNDLALPAEYYRGQEVIPTYNQYCNGKLHWLTLQKQPSKVVIWRERFLFPGAELIFEIDLPDNIDWQVGCYKRGYIGECE